MDEPVSVRRKRVIWRSAFLQFSSNDGDTFAAKHTYVNDSATNDGVELCPLCDDGGYFITCFAENCNAKCHLNCEYFTRELGLIVNDNGGLEFRCRQHFALEKFCKCDKEFDDDSRDMLQCKECKKWFHGSCVGESSRGLGLLSTGFDERQSLSSSSNAVCTKVATDYVCHSCRLIVRNGHKVSETVRSRNLEIENRCASHQIAIKSIEILTNIERSVEPIIDSLLGCDCGADSCRDESDDRNQQALLRRCHTHRVIEKHRYSLEQLRVASDIISNVPTSNIEKAEHYLRECYDIFGVLRLFFYWKTIIDKYCVEFTLWIQKCEEIANEINLLLVESASVCSDNEIQLHSKDIKINRSKLGEVVTEELLRNITRICGEIDKAWLGRPGRLQGKDLDAVSLQFSCIYWLHSIFAIVAMDTVERSKIDITQVDVYTLLVDGCYLLRTLKLTKLKYCSKLLPLFQTYLELAVKWHFDCTTTYIPTNSPKKVRKNFYNLNMLRNTYWQKFSSDQDDYDVSNIETTNTKSFAKVRRYLCKCSRRSGCFSDLPQSDEKAMFCSDFCAHSSAEELLVSLLELRRGFCQRILSDSNKIIDSSAAESIACNDRIKNSNSDWEIYRDSIYGAFIMEESDFDRTFNRAMENMNCLKSLGSNVEKGKDDMLQRVDSNLVDMNNIGDIDSSRSSDSAGGGGEGGEGESISSGRDKNSANSRLLPSPNPLSQISSHVLKSNTFLSKHDYRMSFRLKLENLIQKSIERSGDFMFKFGFDRLGVGRRAVLAIFAAEVEAAVYATHIGTISTGRVTETGAGAGTFSSVTDSKDKDKLAGDIHRIVPSMERYEAHCSNLIIRFDSVPLQFPIINTASGVSTTIHVLETKNRDYDILSIIFDSGSSTTSTRLSKIISETLPPIINEVKLPVLSNPVVATSQHAIVGPPIPPSGEGKDTGGGGVVVNSKYCFAFQRTGECYRGLSCKFSHVDSSKNAGNKHEEGERKRKLDAMITNTSDSSSSNSSSIGAGRLSVTKSLSESKGFFYQTKPIVMLQPKRL